MPKFAPTDEQIATRVQQGEMEVFEILVNRYRDRLLNYGAKILFRPNDLEDIVQEVFIKAYRNLQSFKTEKKFASWLYRIAHNEFINHGKKFSSQLTDYFDLELILPHLRAHTNIEKDFDTQQLKNILEKYIQELGSKYKEPLILHLYEGLEYKEIADILKIPVNTVGIRIMRGKELLRKHINNLI